MAVVEVDSQKAWRLSHILEGHLSDVKAISASALDERTELIHSASRDETARSWYRDVASDSAKFQRGATYQGKRYQNAIAHMGKTTGRPSGSTFLGGLDSRILVYETKATYSEKPQHINRQILQEHYDNVCHLSVSDGRSMGIQILLISSSWDCTTRVWRLNEKSEDWDHLHTLKGHERAVWAAEVLDARAGLEKYLTASADLFIRLFYGEQLMRVYSGHTDVVRAISILPRKCTSTSKEGDANDVEDLFVTASNDGSLRLWSSDKKRCPPGQPTNGGEALKVLRAHDSDDLLYDVKYAGTLSGTNDQAVFSCGEGGVLRGWNVDTGIIIASIQQPVTSVWSIAIMPYSGDIVTANSDGKVRIFTQRSKSEGEKRDECGISEVTDEELQIHERLCEDIVASKAKSQGTVGQASEESSRSHTIKETSHDVVIGIDVSDDSEPLPFGINRGDDIRSAAQTFIQTHSLPASYEDRIVEFVQQVMPQ